MFSDQPVWTLDHLDELDRLFVQHPDESKRSFDTKFREQLDGASEGTRHLAAEFLWLLFAFVSTLMTAETMRSWVRRVWNGWSTGGDGPALSKLDTVILDGIGNPGAAYNYNRPWELAFAITLVRAFKRLALDKQESLSVEPWEFANWIDTIDHERRPQFRDILLHLLFPDEFERIASRSDKEDVVAAFGELVANQELGSEEDSDDTSRDRRLLSIRRYLEERLDRDHLDFYEPPLNSLWLSARRQGINDEVLSPLDALEHRRQVVLYGPPGTGKTFMARELGTRAIQKVALRAYGARYFDRPSEHWKHLAEQRVHHVQLHPGWSYESFVGGLHLTSGLGTVYRPGYLLRLLAQMAEEAGEEADLPHVLILDEINRTDLSRLLGEVFWALEYRGKPAMLGSTASEGEERELQIPSRLLVIGTMNLIDQSLEEVDFALRRRFVWFAHTFSEEAAEHVLASRWRTLAGAHGISERRWSNIEADVRRLVKAGAALNREIREDEYLGARYEIGHTYLAETMHMVVDRQVRSNPRRVFWRGSKPAPPLVALWQHHLQPLLEQYLAGLDADQRLEKLDRWRATFYAVPELDED